MDGAINLNVESSARSLTNWWALAGVDEVVSDTPVNWLKRDIRAETKQTATSTAVAAKPLAKSAEVSQAKPVQPLADWPGDVDSLKAMIASGALLPGNMFGGKPVVPASAAGCDFMIISDMPDSDENTVGILGSGASGRLLTAMLSAIGIELSQCYWTALATTIPATGELPDASLPQLADFARHQMEMVNPGHIILLGDVATKAILGGNTVGGLRNINHDGRNKAVLTTFHPRSLLLRPAFKVQAWKDLQMFAKRDLA